MDTDYQEPEQAHYDLSNWRPITFDQTAAMEILSELRRVVAELDKINVRLSVLDGIKIPSWLRK